MERMVYRNCCLFHMCDICVMFVSPASPNIRISRLRLLLFIVVVYKLIATSIRPITPTYFHALSLLSTFVSCDRKGYFKKKIRTAFSGPKKLLSSCRVSNFKIFDYSKKILAIAKARTFHPNRSWKQSLAVIKIWCVLMLGHKYVHHDTDVLYRPRPLSLRSSLKSLHSACYWKRINSNQYQFLLYL